MCSYMRCYNNVEQICCRCNNELIMKGIKHVEPEWDLSCWLGKVVYVCGKQKGIQKNFKIQGIF